LAGIIDVAKKAKVSPSTVSRVLNNGLVKKETRAKVMRVIQELGYSPCFKARSLRSGMTYTVGCITPAISTAFGYQIIDAIESTLAGKGFNLLLIQAKHPDKHQEMSYANLLRERRVDGLIIVSPREFDQRELEQLADRNMPLIFIEGSVSRYPLPSINPDNYRGGFLATEHLIKAGHRRIAHITGQNHWTPCQDRLRGYKDALEAYGIPFNSKWIGHGDMYINSGMEIAKEMMNSVHKPTAFFGVNDYTAIGIIKALKDAKLKIPQDVAVVGFDDIDLAEFLHPSLSTVRQPLYRIGQEAVRRVLQMIATQESDDSTTILPVELIVRESS
jgi:LacI family transcriptional regulator